MIESKPEKTFIAPNDLVEIIEDRYLCNVNLEIAEEVVGDAIDYYDSIPNNHETQPEDKYIKFLKEQGLEKEEILHAVFFLSTLMFQSNTKTFFDRVSTDINEFEEYCWLYNPELVFLRGLEETKKTCSKYLRPYGWQQKALNGWYHNAEMLVNNYGGNLTNFFKSHHNYAPDISKAIYVAPRAKSYRKEFHRLGPKLTNLFLQWVERYDLYDLKDFDKVGLPVDYQIMRVALQTGIVELTDSVNAHNFSFNILSPIIMSLCEKNGWKPRAVSEALWSIGSMKCSKESNTPDSTCPLREDCKGVIRGRGRRDMFLPISENPEFSYWQ